jgi:hypothetical protein
LEATFLLEDFQGGFPKIFFIVFAIADQLSNAWIAGLLLAVEIGLGIALQSLPLAGVAIGKFNRGADQSSGSTGGFLLLNYSCFDLISLWDLPGFNSENQVKTRKLQQ